MADAPSRMPAPLDRGAVERVLARAAELQALQTADPADGVSEAQLLEIGKEVGIAPDALRQALAEERTRVVVAEEPGREARLLGPERVAATRVIPHGATETMAALERILRDEYKLSEKRRYDARRTWERRGDVLSEMDRSLRKNRAVKALAKADEVGATVTAMDDGRCLLRLDADLRERRRRSRTAAVAFSITGLVVGALPVALGLLLAPVAMAPLFLAVGVVPVGLFGIGSVVSLRDQREYAQRAQLALEQLLDRLEHEPLPVASLGAGAPPPLADTIAAVAHGVREMARAVTDAQRNKGTR